MEKHILLMGMTLLSLNCAYAANERHDPFHMQIVMQHMGCTKVNCEHPSENDINNSKLNLIQVKKHYRELLDRQRINDVSITEENHTQYNCINTQVIYKSSDKIMWKDNVTKYVINMHIRIGLDVFLSVSRGQMPLVYTIEEEDARYAVYFVPDMYWQNLQAAQSGFFMFKLPRNTNLKLLGNGKVGIENTEQELNILVDDKGEKTPVSDDIISENKILARRVEFNHVCIR